MFLCNSPVLRDHFFWSLERSLETCLSTLLEDSSLQLSWQKFASHIILKNTFLMLPVFTLTVFQSHNVHSIQWIHQSKPQSKPCAMGLWYWKQFIVAPGILLVGGPRMFERINYSSLTIICGTWGKRCTAHCLNELKLTLNAVMWYISTDVTQQTYEVHGFVLYMPW